MHKHQLGTYNSVYFSVIVPMYNEEENVAQMAAEISQTLQGQIESYEIVLVNDGSTDGTLEAAQRVEENDEHVRVVSYKHNGGRGKALRTGFGHVQGELIATIDADLSYSPETLLDFVRVLEDDSEVDLVLASPYMPGGRTEGVPPLRLAVSRWGNVILSASMPERIHTITSIVRGYRREVLESMTLESNGKEIHLEILSKALAMGYRVKEIPAVLRSRQKGQSKFRFRITALSHLLFTFFEKPILLFGLAGALFLLLGLAVGGYLIWLWQHQALNPNRPFMTLMVLLIVTGTQALSFGFLATQLMHLKREMYKIQGQNMKIYHKGKETD